MDLSFSDLNFNSIEMLPAFETRPAFTVTPKGMLRKRNMLTRCAILVDTQ